MPRRILFLEHNVDGTVGGSHICLLGICKYLSKHHWCPVVCFYQDNVLIPSFKELGVKVLFLEPFQPSALRYRAGRVFARPLAVIQSIVNFLRMTLIRPYAWAKILRRERIELVHLNNSCGSDIDLVIAAKLLGIPVVAHQRGFPPRFNSLERYVASKMARIICVSDAVLVHLAGKGIPNGKMIRVHDGIELEGLRQNRPPEGLREMLGVRQTDLVVGMVGNIKWWKGQHVLVAAAPIIHRRFPNTQFLFIGKSADGKYQQFLEKEIALYGLQDSFIFTGYRPDAMDLIEAMDVVVHASVEPEPFGLVILEAMGKGRPIVAADLGGPKETVVPGVTGVLFESGNAESLADSVCGLLENTEARRQMGHEGARHVRACFGVQRNVRDVETVYFDVVQNA